MSQQPCERCDRAVEDARVCSLCSRDAERALGNVPALMDELDLTVSRQRRFNAMSDGGRSAETPVPFHVHAAEARDVLRNVLVGWSKMAHEEAPALVHGPVHDDCLDLSCSSIRKALDWNTLPKDNPAAMSRYLLRRVEWFRHHELAEVFIDEILGVVRTVNRLVDAPENRTTFAVGPCPEADELGTPCPGEVRAFIPASEHAMARMECDFCATQYETWQWLRAGKRILERRATLTGVDNTSGA